MHRGWGREGACARATHLEPHVDVALLAHLVREDRPRGALLLGGEVDLVRAGFGQLNSVRARADVDELAGRLDALQQDLVADADLVALRAHLVARHDPEKGLCASEKQG